MILHIVTFSFKEYWSWSSLEVIEAEKRTRNHPSHINQIKGWICGRNITNRSIASDFVVVGLFTNRKDLDEYLVHHDHREGVTKWKEVATWNVVDIDLEEDSSQITGALGLVNNLNLSEKSLEEVC
jgi:hypothetical protein